MKNKAWKRRLSIFGFITFLIYTSPIVSSIALRAWEIPATPFAEISNSYDIGIVLCGMTSLRTLPDDRPHFGSTVDRITDAIKLYKEEKIDKILISGGSGYLLFPDLKESLKLKDFCLLMGVDLKDIIIEGESDNTRENARNSIKIIEDQFPNSKLLLITSATHMRRASGCFIKVGAQHDVFSTDIGSSPFSWDFRLLIPNVDALATWTNLIREWVGYAVYWVVGYL